MPCVGVKCPYKNKDVSLIECSTCEGCKAHGAENEDFPLILRKKFLFPQFRHTNDIQVSVTKIVGCLRKHYLELTKDYYMTIESFKAVNMGSAMHDYLEDVWNIKEMRMNWTTPKGNKVFGYFDIINVNDRILYDLKTTSYGKFKLKEKKPNEHDKIQVTIYATMLKKLVGLELNGLRITYVGLGDKVCEEFEVPFIDRTDFINNQTDYLWKCIDTNQIPKGEPMESWECQYCPFSEGCPDKISTAEEKVLKAQLKEDYFDGETDG